MRSRDGVETIRLRGLVQGVGMRPAAARVARRLALDGWVRNDARGVLVLVSGAAERRAAFVEQLLQELPPLAKITSVERREAPVTARGDGVSALASLPGEGQISPRPGVAEDLGVPVPGSGFFIAESEGGRPHTPVSPDAAACAACLAEIFDPAARRFRYPFTNCTHCGPRYTIVTGIPYDRGRTTMATFPPCPACRSEYEDIADRRHHAEPIACPRCGPRVTLSRAGGEGLSPEAVGAIDEVEAAAILLEQGQIVAIKGVGGYHLCCDATRPDAVRRLRERKRRPGKPFALMARDLEMIERHCAVSPEEREALLGPEAPIVLLERRRSAPDIAEEVAPGLRTLGFMLPQSPLHHLLMARLRSPVVCTSGNLSEEPPCADVDEAHERLAGIAGAFLDHDRQIAQPLDDSVVKLADGAARVVRRARGLAPAPLALPPGFDGAPRVLATGAQWRGSIALLAEEGVVLSQHLGDLDDARTFTEHRRTIAALSALFDHAPELVAADAHPDYRSTRAAHEIAAERGLPLIEVQHHHAHIAACLAEHGVPRGAPPVLGIALDGLGLGEGGALWGAEWMIATYTSFTRVATLRPAALLGGDRASLEPWRSLYAHLVDGLGWDELSARFGDLDVVRHLAARPRALLDQALRSNALAPRASSCGRLFDAVAAAAGLHRDRVDHDGQAAIALEQAVTPEALAEASQEDAYPIAIGRLAGSDLPCLDPIGMWRALLLDLQDGADAPRIAARFHASLAAAIVRLAREVLRAHGAAAQVEGASGALQTERRVETVVLSGGVWQNRVLLELVAPRLRAGGLRVLVPRAVPANDGGIALGQAIVAAARSLEYGPLARPPSGVSSRASAARVADAGEAGQERSRRGPKSCV